MTAQTSSVRLRKLIAAALFVAIAYVFRFVFHFNAMFLTFEFKDAIIAIGALYLGPVWGIGMAAVVALLEFVTLSSTGVYGLLMNFLAAATFAGVSALVYRFRRTMGGAVLGLCAGVCALVAVMLPANLLITPYFMGTTVGVVVKLIPKLLLPFNLVKGMLNAGVVLLLYKPVTTALRRARLLDVHNEAQPAPDTARARVYQSLPVVTTAVLMIAVSLVIFFVFLGGNFSVGT